jgi:hypothetical protein
LAATINRVYEDSSERTTEGEALMRRSLLDRIVRDHGAQPGMDAVAGSIETGVLSVIDSPAESKSLHVAIIRHPCEVPDEWVES